MKKKLSTNGREGTSFTRTERLEEPGVGDIATNHDIEVDTR